MSISAFDSAMLNINQIIRSRGLAPQSTNKPQGLFGTTIEPKNNIGQTVGQQSGGSVTVSNSNSGQVSQVNVGTLGANGQLSLTGQVVQTAKAATMTIVGASDGTVQTTGKYLLTGNGGSTTVSINQGDTLATVAANINQSTQKTGVVASVSGKNLVLTSTTVGSKSTIGFKPVESNSQAVSGVDSTQVGSFHVINQQVGTTDTVSGNVVSTAGTAGLVYQGTTGSTVAGSATFRLTGSQGSANISLTQGQSLLSAAAAINQQVNLTGVAAHVQGNDLYLTSTTTGSTATVRVDNVVKTQQVTTSGVNNSQVGSVTVNSIDADTTHQLTGEVVQSATQAQVALQGSSQDTVIDSATFHLTGSIGSADISIQQGQSLSDVAGQINQQTPSTGVTASVDNHQLVFQSTDAGSASNVAVQLTDITHTTVVSGVDSQQLASFQADSISAGASDTINGEVTQAATQATVTLQGTSQDTVIDSATFHLTGSLGSTDVSIQQGQQLTDVAAQINGQSGSTGVTASVADHQLVFQSTDLGSASNVAVQLTDITHTTVTSGVNSQQFTALNVNSLTDDASDTISGDVTHAATQATVTLQGSNQDTVVDSATFQLTGSIGSTNVSITKGQTLSSIASQINTQSSSTGVTASVSNHQLVFQSTDVGSAANVAVQLTDLSYTNSISGVNSQQISSFQTNSLTNGASETLTGSITQTAAKHSWRLRATSDLLARIQLLPCRGRREALNSPHRRSKVFPRSRVKSMPRHRRQASARRSAETH